ncbi:reverse transcriptase domain-containing protein [Tanacetum coccineum]
MSFEVEEAIPVYMATSERIRQILLKKDEAKSDINLLNIGMRAYLRPLQANYVIREIHMGSCGMHVGPRAVVRKAMRQGYYWPTMHADAKTEVDKCDSCQIHSPIPRLPKTFMTSIMAPWPFYQWGMDILGPLTPARGGAKFVVVAIDYFTKWVEAKPLAR